MTPRAGKAFRTSTQRDDLTVTQRHAAGIDVHAAVHFVSVAAADVPAGFVNPDGQLPDGVRKFGTTTPDLEVIEERKRGKEKRTERKRGRSSFFWRGRPRRSVRVSCPPERRHPRPGRGRL
jgi:hypothetical protein